MKRPDIFGGKLLRKVENTIFQLTHKEIIRHEVVVKAQSSPLRCCSRTSFPCSGGPCYTYHTISEHSAATLLQNADCDVVFTSSKGVY